MNATTRKNTDSPEMTNAVLVVLIIATLTFAVAAMTAFGVIL
jgi:hypothetical protein